MVVGRVARLLELSDSRSRVRIAPNLGAAVADMTALTARGEAAILRQWPGDSAGVFDVGMNLLVPFSNRISGGGFTYGGLFHPIAPNLKNEAFPIHGDAFQKPWRVLECDSVSAHLVLDNGSIGPFRYQADVHYRLENGGLRTALSMTNTGTSLPFGGGFHPWFPRNTSTRLNFVSTGVWLEDENHLPTRHLPSGEREDWDFSSLRPLPSDWINNAFTGWDGRAHIAQERSGIEINVSAEPPLDTAIVFSPDRGADFFCFEPVSHAVDSINQPDHPGMIVLARGETLTLTMSLDWVEIGCVA